MDQKPVRRFARISLALLCVFATFTIWGLLGTAMRKEPASVPLVGSAAQSALNRNVILNDATNVTKKVKDAKEQNVLLNDPFISERWGLVRTKAIEAWEVSKGSKNIKVAVIDTGVDIHHKCLEDNLWVNAGEVGIDKDGKDKATNGKDDDGNGFVDDVHGWNFVGNNNDLSDNHGHGTHIAGIIGANTKPGCEFSGMAPKVSIMALKYYDPKSPGANNLKNTIQAIRYAIRMGANVINYSGGGTEYSSEEFAAVKDAEKAGILFIAAAGNERSNTDESGKQYYPADYGLSNIISVTAVNEKETKVLPSSNYGVRTVDLAAPGDQIKSTLPGNTYGKMTGTSQATAWVTGVAVLVMALRTEFTAPDIKKYILRTGDEYATLLSKTGNAKLLNSYKALTSLDKGVSASGVTTANTERTSAKSFTANPGSTVREVTPSALSSSGERDPAEQIGSFGKDLIQAIGGRAPKAATRPRSNEAKDPNVGD